MKGNRDSKTLCSITYPTKKKPPKLCILGWPNLLKVEITIMIITTFRPCQSQKPGGVVWPIQDLHCCASPSHQCQPWSVPNSREWKPTLRKGSRQPLQQKHLYGGWHKTSRVPQNTLCTLCGMRSLLTLLTSMPLPPKN